MKSVRKAAALLMALTLTAASALSASAANWAYAGLALQSEEAAIDTIYYASSYFGGEGLVNPQTAEPYSEEELSAIKAGAEEGGDAYIEAPDMAVLGLKVFGKENIFWYDSEGAAAIVSHADPLALNASSGSVSDAEGNKVAEAMVWAYEGLALASEEAGVDAIYYTSLYFEKEGRINPQTAEPYTGEELAAIYEAADSYLLAPAGSVVGMRVFGEDTIYWYGEEAAEAIVASAAPLFLNAETGVMTDAAGSETAGPM